MRKVISENLKPLEKKITLPTLVLWGERDKMTPYSDARYLRENIENAQMASFKNAGHSIPYKRPKTLAKEINKWHKHTKLS